MRKQLYLLIAAMMAMFFALASVACGGGSGNKGVGVTSVTVAPSTATLAPGATQQLTATVAPANATNPTVTWSSGNTAVATVNSATGLVTAVAAGNATIIATADGKTGSCSITVTSQNIPVESVSIKSRMTLINGEAESIAPAFMPPNATNRNVSWASSNAAVASVSADGVVTALSVGATIITVTAEDGGLQATSDLAVVNVYVGGESNYAPIIWKNGQSQMLVTQEQYDNNVNGAAYSVFVADDGNVYVAGFFTDPDNYGLRIPSLWKNGLMHKEYEVGDYFSYGTARSVFALGQDVYVTGFLTDNWEAVGMLWKNNETQILPDVSEYAAAMSVTVSGSDVYVAGYDLDPDTWGYRALVWKGVELSYLEQGDAYETYARSVFVSGGNVYAAGEYYLYDEDRTCAVLWKNGDILRLFDPVNGSHNETANSVFVVGEDVYVAGYYEDAATGRQVAVYWKNNVPYPLSQNPFTTDTQARSIFVFNDEVFAAGYEIAGQYERHPILWKNGVSTRLSVLEPRYNYAYSVFVSNKPPVSEVVPVTGVTVSPNSAAIPVGGSSLLTATIAPGNASNQNVTWTSSSNNVTVTPNGLSATVTAVAPGNAEVTVKTLDGNFSATCSVTVTTVSVTGVTVAPAATTISVGGTRQLAAAIAPGNASNQNVIWTSSSNNVTVTPNGLSATVTAVAPGDATITVTTQDGGKTASCAVTVTATTVPEVYMAGYESNAQQVYVATLWANGVPQSLSDGASSAEANSVFVSDDKVYVAGYENNAQSFSVAKLWEDGVPQNLSDGSSYVHAESVFASGDDVYVAGYERNAQNVIIAKLWVNGVPQELGHGNTHAIARSVFASGGNVYVAGHQFNAQYDYIATLWVNGVPQSLGDGSSDTYAYSVFVSDGNVYVAGNESGSQGSIATLWVNGVPQSLSSDGIGAYANSVFASGGDVYVAGLEMDADYFQTAKLWLNGVPQNLGVGSNETYAYSVFVSDGVLYVAGIEVRGIIDVATLWVNGVPQSLSDGSRNSYVYSVFVK